VNATQERLPQCDGWVASLRGHTVAYTGNVLIDGTRVSQADCAKRAERKGAGWRDDWSSEVTLLVHGDLAGKQVIDPERGYSRKLVSALHSRRRGRHVHVVDADGFGDLLAGVTASCRRLGRRGGQVVVVPEVGDRILGGPLKPRRAPNRTGSEALRIDWDRVDAATAAHEQTIRALSAHLGRTGIKARAHWRGGPQFDAGWARDRTVYVAEVKSLRGARQDQQIRLGLGQLLDYVYRTPKGAGRVAPVLVLERQPAGDHWGGLCAAHGVHLTWAPDFPGI
jgi:hypothetical protein